MSFEKAMEKNNLYQGEIETPIQWLHRQSYDLDSDDKLTSDIFEIAAEKQLILMEQFSKWLIDNKWEIDYRKGTRYRDWETDRKSTRLNSSHSAKSRMPSSA